MPNMEFHRSIICSIAPFCAIVKSFYGKFFSNRGRQGLRDGAGGFGRAALCRKVPHGNLSKKEQVFCVHSSNIRENHCLFREIEYNSLEVVTNL